jgi:hypothetical protein
MPSGRRARLQKLRERVLQRRQAGAVETKLADWLAEMQTAAPVAPSQPARRWPCPNEGCTGLLVYAQETCTTCGAHLSWRVPS